MIQHYYGAPTGLQDTTNLAHRDSDIGSVVKHSVRINQVERVVQKIQFLSVSNLEIPLQASLFEILSGKIDSCIGQVNSGVIRARRRELNAVSAQTATDFQNAPALCGGEIRGIANMPFLRVTM